LLTPGDRSHPQSVRAILLGILVTSLLLGLEALYLESLHPAHFLFALSILCLLGMQTRLHLDNTLVSVLVCCLFLVALFYNSVTGGGIHDPGMLAYPILVFVGGLMFGKRLLPLFFTASCVSLVLIGLFEIFGLIRTPFHTDASDILTQVILVAAETYLVWLTLENLETSNQRAEQSEARLNESYNMTLEGWVKALEFRDRETVGHCRRVASLCVQLAYQLGLGREEVITIYRGALLHDIGKMAIPDSILFKPGPLSEAEWDLMHQHPLYAREMLQEIPFLRASILIPYCHHERWDGLGYPRGLRMEQIPLAARIFTVVDHWEALSSDRPYRRALPPEHVKAYFEQNSGVIFDPQIAGLFLQMMTSPDHPVPAYEEEQEAVLGPVSLQISTRV
jgi:hypothetical protein